jgi:hypothetical protein
MEKFHPTVNYQNSKYCIVVLYHTIHELVGNYKTNNKLV